MSTNIVMHPEQPVKTKRFVAPPTDEQRAEYEQGKRAYRHGWSKYACSSDDMVSGWEFCQNHGERHGWMRNPDARGADAYGRAMMAQASTSEVM